MSRDDAARAVRDLMRAFRDNMLNFAARHGPDIADRFALPVGEFVGVLEAEIRNALNSFADAKSPYKDEGVRIDVSITANRIPRRLFFLIGEGLDAVRPDPPYTVSQWADKNRVLSSVSSAEPGDWRTSRTPYLREIMDNLSAYSPVREQAVMKGVQIGMSEAGFNFVGYTIHHAPGPMMYVMPSLDMAKKFSKTRIDPMIEASPALSAKIRPARSRDSGNTIFSKEYDGGVFVLTGANSESGLRGLPVKALVLDEVDGYPESAEESGDPVSLAIDRTSAFSARRKIFMLSTPLLKASSRIGKAFREGDQRYYNVKCEKCGKLQPITWDKIKWEPGKPETAVFVCLETVDKKTGEISGCGHRHPNHRKSTCLPKKMGRSGFLLPRQSDRITAAITLARSIRLGIHGRNAPFASSPQRKTLPCCKHSSITCLAKNGTIPRVKQ